MNINRNFITNQIFELKKSVINLLNKTGFRCSHHRKNKWAIQCSFLIETEVVKFLDVQNYKLLDRNTKYPIYII